jgi:hypothetical protein
MIRHSPNRLGSQFAKINTGLTQIESNYVQGIMVVSGELPQNTPLDYQRSRYNRQTKSEG